ncbi:Glutathione S-transferase U10 [Abeliophyllum distichum]|uniref:Glutathione S-transferase n=1 Tax=Abeliophyllum distichum TaxID=126358 RepID=A0ABD1RX15_9LAMI
MVPVLVHHGKHIVESLVILEYIDEMWRYEPRILPDDPYERATVRFWAGYIQQLLESMEKLKQHKREPWRMCLRLRVLEDGMKNFLSERNAKIYKENLGLLDIMMVATLGAYRAQEEFLGVKVIDPEKYPLIFKWVTNLVELPACERDHTPT